nr:hypothetical protein BgiMline_034185 [Biomphalaria glabrata]
MISSSFNSLFILFRKKLISHFKPGDDGVINSRIQRWNKTGALVCLFVVLYFCGNKFYLWSFCSCQSGSRWM